MLGFRFELGFGLKIVLTRLTLAVLHAFDGHYVHEWLARSNYPRYPAHTFVKMTKAAECFYIT